MLLSRAVPVSTRLSRQVREPLAVMGILRGKRTKSKDGQGWHDKSVEGRKTALETALKTIEQTYGAGSIMRFDDTTVKAVPVTSTGSVGLDIALGAGGLPKGRIIEIFGPEASGKTTLALHSVAESQKLGGSCVFVDAEHALDTQYAQRLGVDMKSLLISQPDHGEQALEIVDTLVRSGAVDTLVVDSVAALVPRAEVEGDMGDAHMGLQARLMSQALRKLTHSVAKSNTTLIFINQTRSKIGIMFGNPETTAGGNALKFYSSVRLEIRRVGPIKVGDEIIGNKVRVKVAKNKIAPPFKQAEFDIEFGQGISKSGELIDLGVDCEVLQKNGAYYSFGEQKIGHGRERTKVYLEENPDIMAQVEDLVRESLHIPAAAAPEHDDGAWNEPGDEAVVIPATPDSDTELK